MDYIGLPDDVLFLVKDIDQCLLAKDYERTYFLIISYGKMIPQLNRQLYLEILLNHLSKFINREDICLKIANNTITINKKLLELNKYLLTKIKQIKQPTDEQNYLLLTLIKNFWLISHYETDCALVN